MRQSKRSLLQRQTNLVQPLVTAIVSYYIPWPWNKILTELIATLKPGEDDFGGI